ncbi:MAG: cell division protein FtsA [Candidatus Omnitrophica bacterium]|nr:cell division protein FtsA [Candidatus Omnitrophota bacterium]
MVKKFFKQKFFCGLDLGANRIKVAILKTSPVEGQYELIGDSISKVHGFKKSSVTDIAELSESIRSAVQSAAQKAQVKVKELNLGLGSDLVVSRRTGTTIPLVEKGHKVITERDLYRLRNLAKMLSSKIDEELIHDIPQYYNVDDDNQALNPVGLYARKLEINTLMILVNANRLRNIFKSVSQAGYEISNVMFNTYASASVVLRDQDSLRGCGLLDIGAQSTNILVFKNGSLKFFDKINVGSDDLSQAVADTLGVSFDLAESIKRSHGYALAGEHDANEEILIKQSNAYKPIKRGAIFDALDKKVEEYTEQLKAFILKEHLYDDMADGMVVIGGGSLLPGLIERISQKLTIPANTGRLRHIHHPQATYVSELIPAVGLAMQGFKTKPLPWDGLGKDNRGVKHIFSKLHDLYQEYF